MQVQWLMFTLHNKLKITSIHKANKTKKANKDPRGSPSKSHKSKIEFQILWNIKIQFIKAQAMLGKTLMAPLILLFMKGHVLQYYKNIKKISFSALQCDHTVSKMTYEEGIKRLQLYAVSVANILWMKIKSPTDPDARLHR